MIFTPRVFRGVFFMLKTSKLYAIMNKKRGDTMRISYAPLFETMKKQDKNKRWLRLNGIHAKTVDTLKNNGIVTTGTIVKLCELLDCGLNDVVEVIK